MLFDAGAVFEEGGLAAIARAAEGGMRDALSLADQCIAFCGNEVSTQNVLSVLGGMDAEFMFSISRALIDSDEKRALTLLDSVFQYGRDLGVFCRDLTAHFRNIMLINACGDARELFDCTDETYEQLCLQAKACPLERTLRTISLLAKAEADMKYLSYPRVLFEAALLRICRPQDELNFEALSERISALETALANGEIHPGEIRHNEQPPQQSEASSASGPNAAPPPSAPPQTQAASAPQSKPAARNGADSHAQQLFDELLPLLPKQTQALAKNPALPWSARMEGDTLTVLLPVAFKAIADALNAKAEEFSQAFAQSHPGTAVRFSAHASAPPKAMGEDDIARIKKVFGEEVKLEIIREKSTL